MSEKSERFSQRVFMEETHSKHRETVPQLDLSILTGSHHQSIILNKGVSPAKPVQGSPDKGQKGITVHKSHPVN